MLSIVFHSELAYQQKVGTKSSLVVELGIWAPTEKTLKLYSYYQSTKGIEKILKQHPPDRRNDQLKTNPMHMERIRTKRKPGPHRPMVAPPTES